MSKELKEQIAKVWNGESSDCACVDEVLRQLDVGQIRVAQKQEDRWIVNEYVKKALLLFFKLSKSQLICGAVCNFFDKVPLKTSGWNESDFLHYGFRAVPNSYVRYSAYIGKSVVLMPCFINVGAYVDDGTMIDSNSLVGSCAQIGKNCHIADGVTIGGVLEPLQSAPVIIEDNCFVGVKSSITEGVIIGEGSVIGAGVTLTASTKIIDRSTGEVFYKKVPPYSVVVPGSYQSGAVNLACAVIIKQVTPQTRAKTSINELLRN